MNRLPEGERQTPLLMGNTGYRPPVQMEDLTLAPLNLKGLLGTLRNRLGLILGLALLTTGAATYVVRRERPFYSSTAVIRLNDVRGALAGPLADRTVGGFGESVDPIRSQVEILSSRAVGALVVDSVPELRLRVNGIPFDAIRNLDAKERPGGDSVQLQLGPTLVTAKAESTQAQAAYGSIMHLNGLRFSVDRRSPGNAGIRLLTKESAIHNLLSRLTVKPRPATDVIDVTYLDLDPKLASRVVNAVVNVFQSVNAQTAQQQSVRRRKFLEGQLRYNDSVLDAARGALSAFRGRQRAYSTKLKLSTEQAGLSGLDVRREELEADRRVYQNLLSQLQAGGGGGREGLGALMSAPGISANPVVIHVYEQLVRYQLARDSLTSGAFGRTEGSPQVQRLDSLISATQRDMIAAVQNVLVSTDARVRSLEQLREKNATAFPELSATEDEESRLEEEVEGARKTAASLREEHEKARLAEAVEVGQVEIVDLATLPGARVGIGPFRKIALAFLVGLTLGCALALLLEHLNTSIRRREQVGSTLQIPELSVIPKIGSLRGRRHMARLPRNGNGAARGTAQVADLLLAAMDLQSSGAEAYRLLRTNLIFSQPTDAPSRILVTSPAPGDGKTTVSANLAVSFAQQGLRVLLVDCDLRRGRLHHLFRVSQAPGLAHVLLGTASLEEAIRLTPVSGLSLMPVGVFPPGPAELLGSPAMRDLLDQVSKDFPVVILDAPPVLAASDAAIVASLADATVLVLRAGRTDQADAQHTLQQLTAVGARVVGAVLNDPDARLRSQGAYYYSGYYGPDR